MLVVDKVLLWGSSRQSHPPDTGTQPAGISVGYTENQWIPCGRLSTLETRKIERKNALRVTASTFGTFYFYPDGTNIPRYWYSHNRHSRIILITALKFTKYFYIYRIHVKSGFFPPRCNVVGVRCSDLLTWLLGFLSLLLLFAHGSELAQKSGKMGILWSSLESDVTCTRVIQHTMCLPWSLLLEWNLLVIDKCKKCLRGLFRLLDTGWHIALSQTDLKSRLSPYCGAAEVPSAWFLFLIFGRKAHVILIFIKLIFMDHLVCAKYFSNFLIC